MVELLHVTEVFLSKMDYHVKFGMRVENKASNKISVHCFLVNFSDHGKKMLNKRFFDREKVLSSKVSTLPTGD